MNIKIICLGIAFNSTINLLHAVEKLDIFSTQIVMRHMANVTTNMQTVDESILNLVLINSKNEFILDRQRENDTPITKRNVKMHQYLNTQNVFSYNDYIIWDQKITQYNIKYPIELNSFMIARMIEPNAREHIHTINCDGNIYTIYFFNTKDMGFLMFNQKINYISTSYATLENNPSKKLKIVIDDKGKKSIKSDEILARRVYFSHIHDAKGMYGIMAPYRYSIDLQKTFYNISDLCCKKNKIFASLYEEEQIDALIKQFPWLLQNGILTIPSFIKDFEIGCIQDQRIHGIELDGVTKFSGRLAPNSNLKYVKMSPIINKIECNSDVLRSDIKVVFPSDVCRRIIYGQDETIARNMMIYPQISVNNTYYGNTNDIKINFVFGEQRQNHTIAELLVLHYVLNVPMECIDFEEI